MDKTHATLCSELKQILTTIIYIELPLSSLTFHSEFGRIIICQCNGSNKVIGQAETSISEDYHWYREATILNFNQIHTKLYLCTSNHVFFLQWISLLEHTSFAHFIQYILCHLTQHIYVYAILHHICLGQLESQKCNAWVALYSSIQASQYIHKYIQPSYTNTLKFSIRITVPTVGNNLPADIFSVSHLSLLCSLYLNTFACSPTHFKYIITVFIFCLFN